VKEGTIVEGVAAPQQDFTRDERAG
jgi:hypothetical protein